MSDPVNGGEAEYLPVEGGVNRQQWAPVPSVFGGAVAVRPQFTNLPADRTHAHLLSKAALTRENALEEQPTRDIVCRWLVVTPVRRVARGTGEVSEWIRVVFIAPDGTCVSSNSRPVLEQMAQLAQLLGPGPWEPPLRLRLIKNKGGEFGQYHTLELLPDEPPPKKGK